MPECVDGEGVREQLTNVLRVIRGYDASRAGLSYGLSAAINDRLNQLVGTPRGANRTNRRKYVTDLQAYLDDLIDKAKELEFAAPLVKGPAE